MKRIKSFVPIELYFSLLRFTLGNQYTAHVLLDFSLTVKAAPHECVIRTGQP